MSKKELKEEIEKEEKKGNTLKIISNIVYVIVFIIILALLIVVALQRFSNNNISLGGIRIFNVSTGSMIPKYEVGDILISKTIDPKDIKVGDDVVYMGEKGDFAGKIVTHQVIGINEENGELKFHTKGIANDLEDPVVSQNQIYGVIVYKIVTLSLISKAINNMFVFFFLVFIPLAILIYIKAMEMKRTINSKDDEDEIEEAEKERKEIVEELQKEKEEKEEKEKKENKKNEDKNNDKE